MTSSQEKPVVRPARPEDAAVLVELNRQFNAVEMPVEQVQASLARNQVERVLVAECEGQVVGFGCVHLTQSFCYPGYIADMTELFVRPEFRKRGVGHALVKAAEDVARSAGADELLLRASTMNAEARSLCESAGYVPCNHVAYTKMLPLRHSAKG